MAKRNKIRYQSKPKDRKTFALTGRVFLKFEDEEEEIDTAVKGDLLVYPCNDLQNILEEVGYRTKGYAGYFKVDVFEGNVWCLVLVNDIFTHQEHHFSKTEHPIDTFQLCGEILVALAGKSVVRTYREHYQLADSDEEAEPAQ